MSSILGSAPGIIVGVGVGAATSAALEPAIEVPRQQAWRSNPARVLEPELLARLVAQGGIKLDAAQDEAAASGYSSDRLDSLVYLAQNVPGTAELLFLWRLGAITKTQWTEGMVKLGVRPDWIERVAETFTVPLSAENAAVMIQRSVIPNQGQLPDIEPPGPGNVPRYPQVEIDAYASAQAYGTSNPQLDALTRIVGLPASPDLAARMTFRDIITEGDFALAIAQGNTRVEWTPYLLDGFRQILTANQYAELQLRGYSTEAERRANTAKWGMADTDSDLLYDVLGRGLGTAAITRGLARGGSYDGTAKTAPEPWLSSLERGNTRPEWYDLAYHYYEYEWPNYFVLKPMATAGEIPAGLVNGLLLALGWRPDLCALVTASWTGATLKEPEPPTTYADALDAWEGGTATAADKAVTKAQTQLWTAAHKSYVNGLSSDAEAETDLTLAGVAADAIPQVLGFWRAERAIERRSLTPAQVKKAVTAGTLTQADALARLEALGYSATDAQTFLTD